MSRSFRTAGRKDLGYTVDTLTVDFHGVVSAMHQAAQDKVAQLERQMTELASATIEFPGSLTLLKGTAKFLDGNTVQIESADAGAPQIITARHFVIATGSAPRILDTIPVDGERILTSDHIATLKEFPKSLVILGAGVVGCEFATIFANYGQTKVFLIDRADRILPFEDEEISRICSNNLEARGVTIHHEAQLVSMKPVAGGVHYTIRHSSGGIETIAVEKALISVGRVPSTSGLGLELAGVELDAQGYIKTENCRSTASHVYAAGDITADVALVSVAEIEGRYAVESMYEQKQTTKLRYDNLSTIMFLDPEVAAIGLNEIQAQAKRIPYRVATYGYSLVNRAIAMRATDGFVKLLVSDDDEERLLGMRALGEHASTTIQTAALIMEQNRSASILSELFHPHPAITEILQECVRLLNGNSIYKPHVFRSELRISSVRYDTNTEATK